ncbi:hypothetical protein CANARDRAFT_174765 [[Candida] arabinofermentans NRRL YB-2248]|uniref:EamA domain-containing protein n=1 Tax=[Candida] arabinofermentans NRRL YB-2248 TaxID=983967 RepID=A0A1E4T4N9_9ASCO|nr:hypothetical protein CANARDRAFT_174765 [[Candida] arabinofermentans NRRL YB-2248]
MSQSSPSLTGRGLSSKSPRIRSPVILLKSPRFSSNLVLKSPLQKDNMLEITDEEVVEEVMDIIKTEERRRWMSGLFYLFLVVATWVIAVQLTNNVMKNDDYDHPLFVAYINGSLFMVFGLGHGFSMIKSLFKRIFFRSFEHINLSPGSNYGSCNENNSNQHQRMRNEAEVVIHTPTMQLSTKQILILSCQAALIYYANAACATTSLKYTSASNQTILATTSSLFTLTVGSLVGVESFSIAKLASIMVSISGILMITMSDKESSTVDLLNELKNPLLGDLLSITAAFSYSCYLVLLRLRMGEETNPENDKLVFTFLGLFTLILVFPILLFADFVGFEELSLPENNTILMIIFISGLLNAISDYCSIMASLLTSPLMTSLSLSTAIPVSMICDSIFYNTVSTSVYYYFGIIMIFSSFVFMNMSNEDEIIKEAIDDAIEEAINVDEMLSPILSPYLHGQGQSNGLFNFHSNDEIPGMSIDAASGSASFVNNEDIEDDISETPGHSHLGPHVVVTGGYNHKYFIREVGNSNSDMN